MTTYADAVLQDSPVFYFNCNETSGSVLADASGNGHSGNLFAPYSLQAAAMSAATGTAVAFSGGRCEIPYNSSLKPAGDYSIELVCKFVDATYGMLFGIFNAAQPYNGPTVFSNYRQSASNDTSSGYVTFRDSGDVSYAIEYKPNGGTYADNVCRHFLFVRRGLILELWENGAQVASKQLPDIRNVTDNPTLYIMGRPSLQMVTGTVDEVAMYNYALDPKRIALHAAAAANMARVAGSAKLDTGAKANVVVARDWVTKKLAAQIVPDADGSFTLYVPNSKVDVTAFGPDGYQPITHGPIDPVPLA